jgi:hypothetical protein
LFYLFIVFLQSTQDTFFIIPVYLQSVQVHSVNWLKEVDECLGEGRSLVRCDLRDRLKRVISKRDGRVYLKQVPTSDGSLEVI